jgi:hypothetical protein
LNPPHQRARTSLLRKESGLVSGDPASFTIGRSSPLRAYVASSHGNPWLEWGCSALLASTVCYLRSTRTPHNTCLRLNSRQHASLLEYADNGTLQRRFCNIELYMECDICFTLHIALTVGPLPLSISIFILISLSSPLCPAFATRGQK